jgi:very-short-patch-repair endonuclease
VPTVVEVVHRSGGIATRRALVLATSQEEVRCAIDSGEVVALTRRRFALPELGESRKTVAALSAVLSHRSAALHWGWAVKTEPSRPEVVVARNRRMSPDQTRRVVVHRGALGADDVVDGVTSKDRTLLDCLRLPGDEALAVADSALREGESALHLAAIARDARGPGSAGARRVAALATSRAANPFESTLRWTAHDVEGLDLRPQVPIHDPDFLGRPDLVDTHLRIVAEADSFEWHGGRAALARDARRYNALVVRGWLVLRFSWDDVMHCPDLVRATLEAAVRERTYRPREA